MIKIKLDTTEKIKEFAQCTLQLESNVTIYSGRYIINGKSIMGILSLDLSKTLTLEVEDNVEEKKLTNKLTELNIVVQD